MSTSGWYPTYDDGDVFAQDAVVHAAFRESFPIALDIYEQLFDGVFGSELFVEWLQCIEHWQLHIVGGPGAGKTTFAALVAKRIREGISMSEDQTTQLATIFIHDDWIENELTFLEDLLDSIYKQVTPPGSAVNAETQAAYSAYMKSQHTGQRASQRLELVAKALRHRTVGLNRKGDVVLIIDHLDQCSPALRELMQRELSMLQDEGLKILTTSRLPRHEPAVVRWCDYHPRDRPLQVFWRCSNCQKTDVCVHCKGEQSFCKNCGLEGTWKAPEQYTLALDGISEDIMANYLMWGLETEHGNLGFGTLEDASNPPLSSFGLAFRATMHGTAGSEWTQKIVRYVGGSILQAKLALDRIHSSASPDAIDLVPKRIPRNVQAQFNTAISTIQQQSADQDSIALKAIAAVGQKGEAVQGLALSRLANLLRERPHRPGSRTLPPRSPEDILHAANGYLRLVPPSFRGREHTIAACHRLFWMFVNDEYNEDLIMAYAQLPTSKVPKSFTFQSPLPLHLPAFQPPPPNSRRESSESMKGRTLFSSPAPMVSPPEEVGLDVQ